MGEYLKSSMPVVAGLPEAARAVISRVEYVYSDDVRMVLTQGSIDAAPGQVGFMLDIDVIWEKREPIGRQEALLLARDLRVREREAFEAIITDKARELFDGT